MQEEHCGYDGSFTQCQGADEVQRNDRVGAVDEEESEKCTNEIVGITERLRQKAKC